MHQEENPKLEVTARVIGVIRTPFTEPAGTKWRLDLFRMRSCFEVNAPSIFDAYCQMSIKIIFI